MSLISVDEALRLIANSCVVTSSEQIDLMKAGARVLAEDITARRNQPPFRASAMDGFALRADQTPGRFEIIGQAAAGHRFNGQLSDSQAVRIHTGAPVPEGADAIAPIEITKETANRVEVLEKITRGKYIRPRGLDFSEGDVLLKAGQKLTPARLGLAASMDVPIVPVRKKPIIALLASGDELARPGDSRDEDKIVSANSFGLAELLGAHGAQITDLGEAGDNMDSLRDILSRVQNIDMLITSGGVSVGGRDLIRAALEEQGFEAIFHGIAMRPGKPLLFGKMRQAIVMGLPGNPVSALVCAYIFALPCLAHLLGTQPENRMMNIITASDLPENDSRQDYLRAKLTFKNNNWHGEIFSQQDSAMLYNLSQSHGLIVRPPHAAAVRKGETVLAFRLN